MSAPSNHERAFADHLITLADRQDRAALAALRRGLGKGPGETAEPYLYVGRFLPEEPWREAAFLLTAALFALHPLPWPGATDPRRSNLGGSLARLSRNVESDSVERRVVALLNSHSDDLPDHLRRIVALLKTHDIPVDWAQLLHDVQGWDWPSRSVQRAWARSFWADPGTADETEPATAGDALAPLDA